MCSPINLAAVRLLLDTEGNPRVIDFAMRHNRWRDLQDVAQWCDTGIPAELGEPIRTRVVMALQRVRQRTHPLNYAAIARLVESEAGGDSRPT